MLVTPGTPPERVDLLQKTLAEIMRDPAFIAEVKKLNLSANYAGADEVRATVEQAMTTLDDRRASPRCATSRSTATISKPGRSPGETECPASSTISPSPPTTTRLLGMFYRAVFGMKVSGDTSREMSAISVGDGYVGMTLIPRRGGRKAGLDHFGIEVEDLDKVRDKMAKKYPDIEIVKRPGNRPFASYSAHDPAGNYFDLSQPGHENRAEVYAKGEWKQDNDLQPFRVARARRRQAWRISTSTCSSSMRVTHRRSRAAIT